MRVAMIQQAWTGQMASMLRRSEELVAEAAQAGAELVVLQELHAGPYFCQQAEVARCDLAEPLGGELCQRLGDLAADLDIVLIGSFFEYRAPGLHHNTAVVFERDGEIAGVYRKMHIPDDPGFHEKFYFAPGDLGFTPIDTSLGRLGVLVCWDQWFPEAARLMALAGAEILIYPTAIAWTPDEDPDEQQRQRSAWSIVQRGHAIANGLPVVAVNRVGRETDPSGSVLDFWGSSFACGPQGELLAEMDTQPGMALVDIDMPRTEQVRRWWPFLRDRRIDAYAGMLERYLE